MRSVLKTVNLVLLLMVYLVIGCGTSETESERKSDYIFNQKPRIVFIDDCQLLAQAPVEDTERSIIEWLDRELDGVPITTFCIHVAKPDMVYYESKVGEIICERFNFDRVPYRAIPVLRENGTDILKLVIEHLKPRGIEVLAEIRMSDTHHQNHDPENYQAPQFGIDHPEYIIKQPDGRTNETALDYSYPEVREYRFAIMKEIAENYDVDGLELDFIRWAKHFPLDQGREKAYILTEFVGRIHSMLGDTARKRGREHLTLGVIVPETIDACWKAGVDVKTWVDNGWLDFVTVSTFNTTDPMLPMAEFAEIKSGTDCQLLANIGNLIGGISAKLPQIAGRGTGQFSDTYSGMMLTVPEARACAANYYAWGAQGISYWNVNCHMGPEGSAKTAYPKYWEQMWAWMKAVADPQNVYEGPRSYHYLPLSKDHYLQGVESRNRPWFAKGLSPLGAKKLQPLEFSKDDRGRTKLYPFRMADGRNGEKLEGTLRFWFYHITSQDDVTVAINGKEIDSSKIRKYPAGEFRKGLPGVRFEIDLKDCPPFRGNNELGLTLKTLPEGNEIPLMEELEVFVK